MTCSGSGRLINPSFIFLVLVTHAIAALAKTDVTGGDGALPPKNADEIVRSLRDIVDHGDLSDSQYFSEKLGVLMKGGNAGWQRYPTPCGLSSPPAKSELKFIQRFGYEHIPWYFEIHFGRNYHCNQPYIKYFRPNGLVAVQADILIDWNKVCITADDLKKYFEDGYYSTERGGVVMNYSSHKNNEISLEIWTTAGARKCVTYIFLNQNHYEE